MNYWLWQKTSDRFLENYDILNTVLFLWTKQNIDLIFFRTCTPFLSDEIAIDGTS